jgi:hypothetical protein
MRSFAERVAANAGVAACGTLLCQSVETEECSAPLCAVFSAEGLGVANCPLLAGCSGAMWHHSTISDLNTARAAPLVTLPARL